MPSKAHKLFKDIHLRDIERLMENYETLKGNTKGRKALDHITRSCILLLVAAWESYIEDVTKESVIKICEKLKTPVDLPNSVQNTIGEEMKLVKAPMDIFKLAGDGWKEIYTNSACTTIESWHSPKKGKVDKLFNQYVGIRNMSQNWNTNSLDTIIKLRGSIAHRVKADEYVQPQAVKIYIEEITQMVHHTDMALYNHLRILTGKTPWNYTY